jgi:hypothetical protein
METATVTTTTTTEREEKKSTMTHRRPRRGDFFELRRLETPSHAHNLALGVAYELLSLPLQEVTGGTERVTERNIEKWQKLGHETVFSNAGKTMGYAGLGEFRVEWVDAMRRFMRHSTSAARGRQKGASTIYHTPALFKHVHGVRTTFGLMIDKNETNASSSSSSCESSSTICIKAGEPHVRGLPAGQSGVWFPLSDEDIVGHFPDWPGRSSNRSKRDRDIAATLQHVFVDETIGLLAPFLSPAPPPPGAASSTSSSFPASYVNKYDGIAMGGGCALNVIANTAIEEQLGVAVSVPTAPNDAGIAVGAAWHVMWSARGENDNDDEDHHHHHHYHHHHRRHDLEGDRQHAQEAPHKPRWWHTRRQPLQYMGPGLFDAIRVDTLVQEAILRGKGCLRAEKLDFRAVSQPPQPPFAAAAQRLASLIVDDGLIVGIARGRMEHGPRALGHRSLLADATKQGIKHRLNVLKHREWWRPTAPMVAEEDAQRVFEAVPRTSSPYMSFAPTLTPEAARALPGIAHFDATARPQIVSKEDEPWLHALLMEVRRRCGWAVLINTSFNTKGRPILNTAGEALRLLEESAELDAVLVADWLVVKDTGDETRVGKMETGTGSSSSTARDERVCRVTFVVDGADRVLEFPAPGDDNEHGDDESTGDVDKSSSSYSSLSPSSPSLSSFSTLWSVASAFVLRHKLSGGPGCQEGDYECATTSLVAHMRQQAECS